MNIDKLVPIDFSRKFALVAKDDLLWDDNAKIAFSVFDESVYNSLIKREGFYVISYADRPNTGKQPVSDDVRVDANLDDALFDDALYDNVNAAEVAWSEGDEEAASRETWKPNHDAMVARYQASLPKIIPADDKGWPTAEQQENINPGINPALAPSAVAPAGKLSSLIISKPELSIIEALERFDYKYENGVWSQSEVKPDLAAHNKSTSNNITQEETDALAKSIAMPAEIKIGRPDEVKASFNDSEIARLTDFLSSNGLGIPSELSVDCVIRELAEKHDIDTDKPIYTQAMHEIGDPLKLGMHYLDHDSQLCEYVGSNVSTVIGRYVELLAHPNHLCMCDEVNIKPIKTDSDKLREMVCGEIIDAGLANHPVVNDVVDLMFASKKFTITSNEVK
jgi:hypothetical protein